MIIIFCISTASKFPLSCCALAEGQAVSKLAVVEDPEGWHVAGLRSRLVRNPDELLQAFQAGCQLRDHGFMDLGNVHERTAAVFTVRLAQFNPAADAEDEDTATVCIVTSCLCLAPTQDRLQGSCHRLAVHALSANAHSN